MDICAFFVLFIQFLLALLLSPEGVVGGEGRCCPSNLGYNPLHAIFPDMRGYCNDGSRATPCCSSRECDLVCCNCVEKCLGDPEPDSEQITIRYVSPKTTTKKPKPSIRWKSCPDLESRSHVYVKVSCRPPGRGWTSGTACMTEVPHGTDAQVKCEDFHVPVANKMRAEIKMTCTNGVWRRERAFREFQCELDCRKHGKPLLKGGRVPSHGMPWHAAIFKRGMNNTFTYICGGSLIDKSAVLTAAHCLKGGGVNFDPSDLRVILGAKSSNYSTKDGAKIFGVDTTRVYDSFSEHSLTADIGLMILDEEVQFRDNARPICLPAHDEAQILDYAEVIGFETSSNASGALKAGRVQLLTAAACKSHSSGRSDLNLEPENIQLQEQSEYHEDNDGIESEEKDGIDNQESAAVEEGYKLKPAELCGFSNNGPGYSGVKICKGDSGGGLVGRRGKANYYFLHGIVSNFPYQAQAQRGDRHVGTQCDEGVTIFTKVHSYLDWIEDTLEEIRNPLVDLPDEPYISSSEEDQ